MIWTLLLLAGLAVAVGLWWLRGLPGACLDDPERYSTADALGVDPKDLRWVEGRYIVRPGARRWHVRAEREVGQASCLPRHPGTGGIR